MSEKEHALLFYLLKNEGRAISRDELLEHVWGYESITTRTVDQHVAKLRKKVEDDAANPKHIITLHGYGYRFLSEPNI